MINFKQYLVEEVNKTTDEEVKDTVIRKAAKEMSLEEVLASAKPEAIAITFFKLLSSIVFTLQSDPFHLEVGCQYEISI